MKSLLLSVSISIGLAASASASQVNFSYDNPVVGGFAFAVEQDRLPTTLAGSQLKLYGLYDNFPYSFSIQNSDGIFKGEASWDDGFLLRSPIQPYLREERNTVDITFDIYGRIIGHNISLLGDPCSYESRHEVGKGEHSIKSCAYPPYSDDSDQNFGTRVRGTWTIDGEIDGVSPVPLPASLPLLAAGIMILGFRRRKQRES